MRSAAAAPTRSTAASTTSLQGYAARSSAKSKGPASSSLCVGPDINSVRSGMSGKRRAQPRHRRGTAFSCFPWQILETVGIFTTSLRLSRQRWTELNAVVGTHVCYHDERARAHEVARQLGAGYVVRGSVRQNDDKVRVDVQMTDTETGDPVWVDRFEGGLPDSLSFAREITMRIARAIELEFVDIEARRSLARAGVLEGGDLLKLGFAFLYRPRSPQNLAKARGYFERVLDRDRRSADALAGLAQTHISDTLCRWSLDPAGQVRLAEAQAKRAIEISPKLGYAHHVKGLVLRVQQQHGRALAAFDKAIQLKPSLAPAHAELGFTRGALDRDRKSVV
jgi:hypothetical protein